MATNQGQLTIKSGGQTYIATPTKSTTQANYDAATKSGWKPTSSVVTSDGVRDTTTKNLKDLGTMTNNGIYTSTQDGDAVDSAARKIMEDAQNAPKTAYQLAYERQAKGFNKQLDSLSSNLDASSRQLMDAIRGEYADLIQQQEVTNKAYQGGINVEGMVSGREQYAPNIQGGIVANAINTGIREVANLNAQKNKALAEAENARIQGQFQLMSKKMDVARQLAVDEKDAIQRTFENTQVAKASAKKDMEDYASTLAPSIAPNLTGNATKDYQFISETALGTGGKVSPEYLYKAVTDYQNKQRADQAALYTSDIKEYNFAKTQGYKGDFMKYLQDKQTITTKAGSGQKAFAVLQNAGIPLDSPIYTFLGNLPSETRAFLSETLAKAAEAGDDATVNRLMAGIIFQKSSQSEKDKFTLAASGVPRIDNILTKLEKFKAEHKELDSIKNIKEYLKRAATITNDQDFIDLASEIGLTQVEIRNKFFGSALTGTEQNIAKDFLVQFDKVAGDTTENMITKMKTLRNVLIQNREAIINSYLGAEVGTPSTTGGSVKLQDPKTGETRAFVDLSPEALKEALIAGYKQIQ